MKLYSDMKFITRLIAAWLMLGVIPGLTAQSNYPDEPNHFRIVKVAIPEGTLLEVGGLDVLPGGNLALATRRGDVYIIENPTSSRPFFRLFASGLHEVLGLQYRDGSIYLAQRSELTRLEDTNFDGAADVFETIFAWPLSGNYHEYSFGPKFAPDGSMFVTGNVGFGDVEWWRGKSWVRWRGWTMNITTDGKMEPWATGMRSPAGLGIIDGEFFYTENQGDWVGSGGLWHVKKGSFTGHPAGLSWTGEKNSPLKMTADELYAVVDPRQKNDASGRVIKPENVQREEYVTDYMMKEQFPEFQIPAVWLPHGVLGISNSDIQVIPEGVFGPFSGQVLIGDQGQSKIMRIYLEKVNGEYQGAAWDFRSGFPSGVMRMAWHPDGSLFVGETNRGWGSAGDESMGLNRLVYTGRMPFEMHEVHAMPDGFEITFTKPVNVASARDLASYAVQSFVYKYHPVYGSPPVDQKTHVIKGVRVAEDGLSVRIVLDAPVRYYVHRIRLAGIKSADDNASLVHPEVYYTLNNIPEGQKLDVSQLSTKSSASSTGSANDKMSTEPLETPDGPRVVTTSPPSEEEVKVLLDQWTCSACHRKDSKQVGPAWNEIAKRNYSVERIQQLVSNPEPRNWPDYATPMAPMPHVPKEDVEKIARWINSLN